MVLFLCTIGPSIGLGHLTRMLSVSEALKKNGISDIQFMIFGEPIKRVELETTEHVFISDFVDLLAKAKIIIRTIKPQVVVFDIHLNFINEETKNFFQGLSDLKIPFIGVDSLFPLVDLFNLIWIPSFLIPEKLSNSRNKNIKYGWDTYLLQKRLSTPVWSKGNKVLVLTGGGDICGLGSRMPIEIDNLLPVGCEINWIQGPFASEPVLPVPTRLKWTIHRNIDSLDSFIVQTNYAIAVFGVSFFELLQYGIPAVVFSPYNGKDNRELRALETENVAIVADDYKSAIEDLVNLMNNDSVAGSLSGNSKSKFVLNGAENLAQNIISFLQ